MSIKEILFQSLAELFGGEIADGYYLLVQTAPRNRLIGEASYEPKFFQIDGDLEPPSVLSSIDPESVEGLAVISEEVAYVFRIVNDDEFEIQCSSTWLGKSRLTLLRSQRFGDGTWIVKDGIPRHGPRCQDFSESVFRDDRDMAAGIVNLLADFANPYGGYGCHQESFSVNVQHASLDRNGGTWFGLDRF